MYRTRGGKLVFWCLILLLFAASLLAESPAAMVYGAGGVLLNGANMPQSAAVFAGDRITTLATGAVVLTLAGSSVTVDANSSVAYGDPVLELLSGSATIATEHGLRTRAGALEIVPTTKNGRAKYEVSIANGKVSVIVLEGSVAITENGVGTVLSQGEGADRETASRTTTAPPDPSQSSSHAIPRKVIVGAGAAAAGGVAVVTQLSHRDPASAHRP